MRTVRRLRHHVACGRRRRKAGVGQGENKGYALPLLQDHHAEVQ